MWPALSRLLPDYSDVKVEIVVGHGLANIVAEHDAGVRAGKQVANDMIAVPIGPDMRMAVLGAPSHFEKREVPRGRKTAPSTPASIFACRPMAASMSGNLRSADAGFNVRVERQPGFNSAVLDGFGLAYMPEGLVQRHVAGGRLVRVLADWCPSSSGCHPYYPGRSQPMPAFAWLVDARSYRLIK